MKQLLQQLGGASSVDDGSLYIIGGLGVISIGILLIFLTLSLLP